MRTKFSSQFIMSSMRNACQVVDARQHALSMLHGLEDFFLRDRTNIMGLSRRIVAYRKSFANC